jgi:hypothetical protein
LLFNEKLYTSKYEQSCHFNLGLLVIPLSENFKCTHLTHFADLLKLSRHLLKTAVAIFTGHAPLRKHLVIMSLYDGDPSCRFCRKETERVHHIICCCEALACQCYNVFGNLFIAPKGISITSVRDLCLFIRGTGLLNLS